MFWFFVAFKSKNYCTWVLDLPWKIYVTYIFAELQDMPQWVLYSYVTFYYQNIYLFQYIIEVFKSKL